MNTERPEIPWIDANFSMNRGKVPVEELFRYAGQHVAWSWDGTRILASDPDRQTLDQKLRTSGIDPAHVVHDYIDELDGSSLS